MAARPLSPEEAARLRRRATRASVAVALTLILAKFGAWIATDSVALLTSLIDSSVDLLASAVILVGVHQAARPPDPSHRYGHGKAEPLAALAQAAFIAGSAVILAYEAISRLIRPETVERGWIGIATMLLAIALTSALVLYQHRVVRRTGSVAIGADALHYRWDIAMNAAIIVALLLADATGWPYFDPLFALGIGGFMLWGARSIAAESFGMLMDRELPQEERERIRAIVAAHPHCQGLHDLRTRRSGTGRFIEFHLELDGEMTVSAAHDVADDIEQALMEAFPDAEIMLHQEPAGLEDVRLDARIAAARGRPTGD